MSQKKKTGRFLDKLQKTMTDEKSDVEERFSRADVALGRAKSESKSVQTSPRKTVIRDNFSMPEEDYALIEEIRQRLLRESAVAKNKSEVLRAGLKLLQRLDSEALLEAAEDVRPLKPGRPAQDR